jgi:sugar phosphate isomerase/epimerase
VRLSFNCFNHSAHLELAPTLPAQIQAAASAGYDHVGLDVPSLLAHESRGLPPEAIADELLAHGITCYELVPLSLNADRDMTAKSLRTVTRLASSVRAQQVLATVRSDVSPSIVDGLRMAAETLGELGVAVSVEFMPISPLPSLEAAVRLLEATGDERVGIVIDIWHFILSHSEWSTLDALPLQQIGFVQLDDAAVEAVGTSHDDSMHRRLLPGEGVFPIARFHDVLIAKGYDGVVSVEVLSRPWRDRPIDEFAQATLTATRQVWGAQHATESSGRPLAAGVKRSGPRSG